MKGFWASCLQCLGALTLTGLFIWGVTTFGVVKTVPKEAADGEVILREKVVEVQAEDGTRCIMAPNGTGGYGAIACNWGCKP